MVTVIIYSFFSDINNIESSLDLNPKYLATEASDWQNLGGTAGGKTNGIYTYVNTSNSETSLTFTNRIPVSPGDVIKINCPVGTYYRVFYSEIVGPITAAKYYTVYGGINDHNNWHYDDRELIVPDGANSFFIVMKKSDTSNITPETKPNLYIYIKCIGVLASNINKDINQYDSDPIIMYDSNWQNVSLTINKKQIKITALESNTALAYMERINISPGDKLKITCPNNCGYRILFFTVSGSLSVGTAYYPLSPEESGIDDYYTWCYTSRIIMVPDTAASFTVNIIMNPKENISLSNKPNLIIEKISTLEFIKNIYQQIQIMNNFIPDNNPKIVSILGDSISTFAGDNPTTDTEGRVFADGEWTYSGNRSRYPANNVGYVDQTYWKKFIDAIGGTLGVNESWAGSRVSWDGSSEGQTVGVDKHIASLTRINHLNENGIPDIILVYAGTNDIGNEVTLGEFNTDSPINLSESQISQLPVNTFADAYRTMIIRLQYYYPNSKILVLLPNYTSTYYSATNADIYCEIIKEICDYFGIKYLDLRTCGITLFNMGNYLYDGIHPNSNGMELLYKSLIKFYNNIS